MSGHTIFVWDATYGIPEKNQPVSSSIPDHDTQADNYQQFLADIDAFIAKAEAHYPDMNYGGHYALNNGVYIEPIPYEILNVYSDMIIEAAIHCGLCVYDGMSDTTATPNDKKAYPKGRAQKQWQQQIEAEKAREALLVNDEEAIPQTAKEMKKMVRDIVRERCKQAGIKGVKVCEGVSFYKDFGDTQVELLLSIEAQTGIMQSSLTFYSDIQRYVKSQHFSLFLYSDISFQDAYDIPDELICLGGYEIQDERKIRYEVHRAVDLFIEACPHCQTLLSMYNYLNNAENNPKFKRRFTQNRSIELVTHPSLLLLAKITKQPDYEAIREKLIKEGIAHRIAYKKFEEGKHEREQAQLIKENPEYEIKPFTWFSDEELADSFMKQVAIIDGLDVDELLAMKLPRAIDGLIRD